MCIVCFMTTLGFHRCSLTGAVYMTTVVWKMQRGVTEAIENAVAYTRPVGGAGILLGQYYSQTLQINAFFCS